MNSIFLHRHPTVQFCLFFAIIVIIMFSSNPVMLAISFVFSLILAILLGGRQALKYLISITPLSLLLIAVFVLFNHRGMTNLARFPSGNALTLESIIAAVTSALLFLAVMIWFYSFTKIFSSEKFLVLFGGFSPSFALLISMIMRFVPKIIGYYKEILAVQRVNECADGLLGNIRLAGRSLSIVITHSLENSIDTADSMKCRGFGLSKRTSYTKGTFCSLDGLFLAICATFAAVILIFGIFGVFSVEFYPTYQGVRYDFIAVTGYIAFSLLCAMPLVGKGGD